MNRIKEPSTWAGIGLVAQAVASLLADPRNVQAWASLITGVAAVLIRERGITNLTSN